MAVQAGVEIEEMRGAIWRIPEDENDEQPVAFDLTPYEEAVSLLVDTEGVVTRIASADREEARFHLSYKCDGCLYNALCMRAAADGATTALVPFMSQRDRLALARNGVNALEQLAGLKELPAKGSREPLLETASGAEELVERLNSEWPLGANLDLHVQRARAAARRAGLEVERLPWIHGSGFGSLPDRAVHPTLVQVFVDAQHDYVEDRLYLAAALVVGPEERIEEVIEQTDGRPDEEAEGALIVRWVSRLLDAAHDVSATNEVVLHIYVFDSYDQRVLLDGVRRHLDRLAGIPDFFDLLTETAALSQAMFSFLAQEVRERKNLGLLCHSLPMVARALYFDWSFEGVEYFRVFQARVFDNRRRLDDGRTYESAARFNSQIPLEYAYGAWGELPAPDGDEQRRLLEPFHVSREQLTGFARARLYALRHVEGSFSMKNRYLPKEPVVLPRLGGEVRGAPSLAGLLLEFLYIEHHAKLQALLAHFALPFERRVASGQSILVEALEDCAGGSCRLRLRFDEAGLDAEAAFPQMGPEEGDWMVVSEARNDVRPWEIVRGRIAVIKEIGELELVVELGDMTFPRGEFRFWHGIDMQLAAGRRYVLDPMADDLVAERILDACRNADDNEFLRWIEAGGDAATPRGVDRREERLVREFAAALQAAPSILTPTLRQSEVIGNRLGDRLLLVQGPPGTGKTHTIAWAILARTYAAASMGRRFHVLVTAMTHTAVEVVLRSVQENLRALEQDPATAALAEEMSEIQLFKETARAAQPVPAGMLRIDRNSFRKAMEAPLVLIGAVPSGSHRLLQGISRPIAWERKEFDLLVIDEASQLSLPAAVLAGASLRGEGQAIVVGDHRQMAPILTHHWEKEPRRGVQDVRVYASTFEALRDRSFPQVGLDESFRLHAMAAEFLENHIYRDDEVGFFSRRTYQLASNPGLEGHVAAALDPAYPIIVLEHTEALSLKRNETEIAILDPILAAAQRELGLDGHEGIGVVVPHRAQRAALKKLFPDLAEAGGIDTVERFQGGERDLIIISATASDPEFVLSEARFLLNPNRLNVAFSRPRKKLIVIGSTTIFRLIPPDMEVFENALLWKRLRYEFSADVLWDGRINETQVRVSGRRADGN